MLVAFKNYLYSTPKQSKLPVTQVVVQIPLRMQILSGMQILARY